MYIETDLSLNSRKTEHPPKEENKAGHCHSVFGAIGNSKFLLVTLGEFWAKW
jgi:hypothetical protein